MSGERLNRYGGGLSTWLAAVPGLEDIEEMAMELEVRANRPCWWCGGSGSRSWFEGTGDGAAEHRHPCEHCQGSGLDVELGVSHAG